jgi:hypothetical protein
MSWFRAPVKLFACSGIVLFLVGLLFPPADFAGAAQLHSYVRFFDFQLDLTGYGFFEFVGLVFLISALAYWIVRRLTNRPPNPTLVQLHFWPTLLFAILSVLSAHWVNRVPNPTRLLPNHLLLVFSWCFLVFLVFEAMFAVAAGRQIWLSRNTVANREIPSNS